MAFSLFHETLYLVFAFRNLAPTSVQHVRTIQLQRLRKLDDDKQVDLLNMSLQHLKVGDGQRTHYKQSIVRSKILCLWIVSLVITCLHHFNITALILCNKFSSQILNQQVEPLYFLVPCKLALFGIICEPLRKLIIYIIPESVLVSNGSNMMITLFTTSYSQI